MTFGFANNARGHINIDGAVRFIAMGVYFSCFTGIERKRTEALNFNTLVFRGNVTLNRIGVDQNLQQQKMIETSIANGKLLAGPLSYLL